jgi:hypothetical protein
MFARTLKAFGIGVALIVGTACKGPDSCSCSDDFHFTAVARGANVVPMPMDTTPRGSVHLQFDTTAVGNSIAWTSAVVSSGSGTVDSIALYQVATGAALPAQATAVLCSGAAACAAASGNATIIGGPTVTAHTIWTSAKGYGTQVVFFTTTAQKAAGGAMRGVVYFDPL